MNINIKERKKIEIHPHMQPGGVAFLKSVLRVIAALTSRLSVSHRLYLQAMPLGSPSASKQ